MPWFVYVAISESTNATYVGVALDVQRRLEEHNGNRSGGARRTRAGRPWRIGALAGPLASRGEAQQLEAQVKKLRGMDRVSYLDAWTLGSTAV